MKNKMPRYDEEALEKFRLSGRILRETREEMKRLVKENMLILQVCEKTEALIREKGGKPAFPCNVSINEVAAHYTATPNDKSAIPEGSLVKVDLGVHVDGYVTDTAFTTCFNPELASMVDAAEQALKAAVDCVRAEVSTSKIGGVIENVIKNRGFKPISNLTGHSVGRYLIHAGTSIPNTRPQISLPKLKEGKISVPKLKGGEVYAIEPFVTFPEAGGAVEDSPQETIFRLVRTKSAKSVYSRQLLRYIEDNFRTLPFAERWLRDAVPREHYGQAFKELQAAKAIMGYPVFVEITGKPVAQAEHTVLVEKEGCTVLT